MSQPKLREFCNKRGIEVTAYSPLVNGRSGILDDPSLKEIGSRHGKSTAQVLIRWHLQRNVIVIPKSVFLNEIEENKNIFDFRKKPNWWNVLNWNSTNFSQIVSSIEFFTLVWVLKKWRPSTISTGTRGSSFRWSMGKSETWVTFTILLILNSKTYKYTRFLSETFFVPF